MGDSITSALVIAVLALFVAFMLYWRITRSQALLRQWAREHGYRLERFEFRMFRKGPFLWSSKQQVVYRVLVTDTAGQTRHGWVRLGSWFGGLFSEQVETQWDE